MIKRPMLAADLKKGDPRELQFPLLVSPKLDGIRCLTGNGLVVSRKLKRIPNRHIVDVLQDLPPLDGELMIVDATRPCGYAEFNEVQSAVMTEDGEPNFEYHVFDCWGFAGGFKARLDQADKAVEFVRSAGLPVRLVPHAEIKDLEEFAWFEQYYLSLGWEGIMVRSPDGPYKEGRSTLRQGWLLKLKRFEISEGLVVGFEERLHNENEAEKDERGYTKRSRDREGLTPAGTLGSLILRLSDGTTLGVAGFAEAVAQAIWMDQGAYLGKIARFKHQAYGAKDSPRFGTFAGWRNELDMVEPEDET